MRTSHESPYGANEHNHPLLHSGTAASTVYRRSWAIRVLKAVLGVDLLLMRVYSPANLPGGSVAVNCLPKLAGAYFWPRNVPRGGQLLR